MLLLPVYVEYLGGNRSDIGSIMAIAAVGGLLFRPLTGWALDHIGRRVTLAAGTILLTTGMVLIGFVTEIGPLIYVARFLVGVGAGALFTGYFTLAADVIPPERRTEGIALFGISGLLPLSMNGFIDRMDIAGADMRFIFPGFAIVVLVSIWAVMAIPEPKRIRTSTGRSPHAIRSLLQQKMVPVWIATMIFAGLVAIFMSFVTVAAAKQGVTHPATLWIFYSFAAVSVRLFGARIPDRLGLTNMVVPAIGSYCCAALMAGTASTPEEFMLAGALGGLGHGYCFPVLTALVVNRIPIENRGSGLAAFTALWDVTSLLFPPVFGEIADEYGDSTMFMLAVCMALIGLGVWTMTEAITARRRME